MRLFEILHEDVSTGASQKNIIDILTVQLPQLYHRLTGMAEKLYDNKGSLAGLALLVGGQKSSWYTDVYFKALSPALYNFSKSLPNHLRDQLVQFLVTNIDGRFGAVENDLLPLLKNISKSTKNPALFSAVEATERAKGKYEQRIQKLSIEGEAEDDDLPPAPVSKEKSSIPQQNVTIETIVADVLSRIDKKEAGEIRNAIAKSGNKLVALQRELEKRGIKV
jgi:hypothetical protein